MPRIKNDHKLFDLIISEFGLKNDAQLAKFLELPQPEISRIRCYKKNQLHSNLILNIYDKTGWQIEKIRSLLSVENAS